MVRGGKYGTCLSARVGNRSASIKRNSPGKSLERVRSPPITRPAGRRRRGAGRGRGRHGRGWTSSPRRRMQPPSMSEVALTAGKPIAPPVVGHPRSHAEGTAGPASRAGAALGASPGGAQVGQPTWRAFALAAANRPTEGGYFYAMRVLDLCRRPISASADFANSNVASVVPRARHTVSVRGNSTWHAGFPACAPRSPPPMKADALLESIKDKANDGHRSPGRCRPGRCSGPRMRTTRLP